jgi:hypothetical protein
MPHCQYVNMTYALAYFDVLSFIKKKKGFIDRKFFTLVVGATARTTTKMFLLSKNLQYDRLFHVY